MEIHRGNKPQDATLLCTSSQSPFLGWWWTSNGTWTLEDTQKATEPGKSGKTLTKCWIFLGFHEFSKSTSLFRQNDPKSLTKIPDWLSLTCWKLRSDSGDTPFDLSYRNIKPKIPNSAMAHGFQICATTTAIQNPCIEVVFAVPWGCLA